MKDFQIVINATSYGHSFFPFTEFVPKVLLPILNKPYLGYLLENINRACCTQVIILCSQSNEQEIHSYVKTVYKNPKEINT
jgi:NDP-sugar pyrophosphorylase family protein